MTPQREHKSEPSDASNSLETEEGARGQARAASAEGQSRWRQAFAWTKRRGPLTLGIAFVVLVLIASTIGVEVSHAIGALGGPSTTTTTTTTNSSGSAGSGGNSSAQGESAAEKDAPVFLRGAGYTPGHGAFNAVQCDSTQHCLAVGTDGLDRGVIADTTNGGSTWSDQSVPSGVPPLQAVSCGDAEHCVAVGQGAILSTSNGGATWRLGAPPSKRTTLLGVNCQSGGACLSVGIATPAVSGPYDGVVLASSDSGATWTQVSLPSGTLGMGSVSCISATHCIAVGAGIWVSNNAGANWVSVSMVGGVPPLTSISCSSALHCVAVGPNPNGLNNPFDPALAVVTHDGGASWSHETMPAATASLDAVTCANGGRCLLSGPSEDPSKPAPLYVASDGGDTWQQTPAPAGLTAIAGISCPDTAHCVMVGRHDAQSQVARTSDGNTWSTQTLPMSVPTGP